MKAMGIIFANIYDSSLGELTNKRTIASLPYGGRYRQIDFTLSNMSNSGIRHIGVITKYNYQSLMNHIGLRPGVGPGPGGGGPGVPDSLCPGPQRQLPREAGGAKLRHGLPGKFVGGICHSG